MKIPEVTLESFARNLYNDDVPKELSMPWGSTTPEIRRAYRQKVLLLVSEQQDQKLQ
jgi:hypothetical protein